MQDTIWTQQGTIKLGKHIIWTQQGIILTAIKVQNPNSGCINSYLLCCL